MKLTKESLQQIEENLTEAKSMVLAYEAVLAAHGLDRTNDKHKKTIVMATGSLRDTIREALKKGPATSAEVIDYLKQGNFKLSGKTKLSTRAYIELNALKNNKEITKRGDKYTLT